MRKVFVKIESKKKLKMNNDVIKRGYNTVEKYQKLIRNHKSSTL